MMRKSLFYIFFVVAAPFLHAAAFLTHLYLTDVWCNFENIEEEKRTIMFRGSIFPDIHYITELSRQDTHVEDLLYGDVFLEDNFFRKGSLLHSYIDKKREEFVETYGIYDVIEKFSPTHKATLLKLIEDEYLFATCNRERFRQAFVGDLYKEEYNNKIAKPMIKQWNQYIYQYLSKRPSEWLLELAEKKQTFFGISPDVFFQWSKHLPKLMLDPYIQKYCSDVMEEFRKIFKQAGSVKKEFLCTDRMEHR